VVNSHGVMILDLFNHHY